MVEVRRDRLGAAAGGEVLGAMQRRAALRGREAQQVGRSRAGSRAARTSPTARRRRSPRRSDARRASRRDGTRSGRPGSAPAPRRGRPTRARAARVEVAQRLAHAAAVLHGSRELTRAPPRPIVAHAVRLDGARDPALRGARTSPGSRRPTRCEALREGAPRRRTQPAQDPTELETASSTALHAARAHPWAVLEPDGLVETPSRRHAWHGTSRRLRSSPWSRRSSARSRGASDGTARLAPATPGRVDVACAGSPPTRHDAWSPGERAARHRCCRTYETRAAVTLRVNGLGRRGTARRARGRRRARRARPAARRAARAAGWTSTSCGASSPRTSSCSRRWRAR